MTDAEVRSLEPQFARYLRQFHGCFRTAPGRANFGVYCHGLVSGLPRKSAEPLGLTAGRAARTLQVFLTGSPWSHHTVRDQLHRQVAATLAAIPDDGVGTVAILDETSAVKKGTKTPGVQRQYLGGVGKIENGIVLVHLAVGRGDFKTLIDGELYLPESWADDPERCAAAGLPAGRRCRPKWRLALTQVVRATANGLAFDWVVFDAGYAQLEFLHSLAAEDAQFVGEVPKSFWVRVGRRGRKCRVDAVFSGRGSGRRATPDVRLRLHRETVGDQFWRVRAAWVRLDGSSAKYRLLRLVSEATGEVKYFVAHAPAGVPLDLLVRVAFRRWQVEHAFRQAKTEAGLTHFEGRDYGALMRHTLMALVVIAFAAIQVWRRREKKSGGDGGANLPRVERAVSGVVAAAARDDGAPVGGGHRPLPPGP